MMKPVGVQEFYDYNEGDSETITELLVIKQKLLDLAQPLGKLAYERQSRPSKKMMIPLIKFDARITSVAFAILPPVT